jgi:hypothetical protein
VSQTRWFKEALEVYFQMMQAPASEQRGLLDRYRELIEMAATTGKFTAEQLDNAVRARSRRYRHYRIEGFSEEEAFKLAGET